MTNVYTFYLPALVIAGICIAFCGSASAASPQLPCEFYGAVNVQGVPAPAGTVISAIVNGTPQGTIQVKQPGLYGGSGTFDERLIVMAGENDFAQGAPEITFQINSQAADQKYTYQPGSSTVLNLTIGGTPVVVAQVSGNTSTQSYTVPVQTSVQTPVIQNGSLTAQVQ
jgi:hypothetical protein